MRSAVGAAPLTLSAHLFFWQKKIKNGISRLISLQKKSLYACMDFRCLANAKAGLIRLGNSVGGVVVDKAGIAQ